MTLKGVTHKSWYLRGAEASRFLKNQPKILKSSTIKGLKSSFWVRSYLNQQLIVSNLKNQTLTDRQTDRQTDRMTTITLWGMRALMVNNTYYISQSIIIMLKYFMSRLIYYISQKQVKIKTESAISSHITLLSKISGLFHTSFLHCCS